MSTIPRGVACALLATLLHLLPQGAEAQRGGGTEPPKDKVEQTLKDLSSANDKLRVEASSRLSPLLPELWLRDGDPVLDLFDTLLDDTQVEVRRNVAIAVFQAAWVLWGPPQPQQSVQNGQFLEDNAAKLAARSGMVVGHLSDADAQVREYLLRALAWWLPRPPATAETGFLTNLDDANPEVRMAAYFALGRIRPVTADRLRVLEEKLEADRGFVAAAGNDRLNAIRSLLRIYGRDVEPGGELDPLDGSIPSSLHEDVVLGLTNCLYDADFRVRIHAARTLGAIGPFAADALPRLQEMAHLDKEMPIVREAAEDAMGKIGRVR